MNESPWHVNKCGSWSLSGQTSSSNVTGSGVKYWCHGKFNEHLMTHASKQLNECMQNKWGTTVHYNQQIMFNKIYQKNINGYKSWYLSTLLIAEYHSHYTAQEDQVSAYENHMRGSDSSKIAVNLKPSLTNPGRTSNGPENVTAPIKGRDRLSRIHEEHRQNHYQLHWSS